MQPSPLRRRAALLVAGVALLPMPAAAHAIIVSADPAVDAVLHTPSVPVVLRFNSRIDRERSRSRSCCASTAASTASARA